MNRLYVVVLGIFVIVIATALNDVVAALTVAYDILGGGLLVPILGGFWWKRATGIGALWAMGVGTIVTLGTMFVVGDLLANEPIYFGLASALVAYVVASLLTKPTPASVLKIWTDRLAGGAATDAAACAAAASAASASAASVDSAASDSSKVP